MIRYALICQQGHQFESWFEIRPPTTSRPNAVS